MLTTKTKNNYLLLKDDIGRSKPTTRELPQNEHAYGHAAIPDKEGVGARKSIYTLPLNWQSLINFNY
jgi:Domain of unknown function (DUF4483)